MAKEHEDAMLAGMGVKPGSAPAPAKGPGDYLDSGPKVPAEKPAPPLKKPGFFGQLKSDAKEMFGY